MKSVICGRALLVVLIAVPMRADQVTLKNGDRVSGAIVSMDGTNVTMQSTFFGKISFPWDQVDSVTTEKPLHVVSGGETLQGTLTVASGTAQVGGRAVASSGVTAIRNDAEQHSFERRLAPGLADLWLGEATLGWAGATGNAQTQTFTTGFKADRATRTDKTTVFFNSIRASALAAGVKSKTAQAARGGWSYDRNLTPRLFADLFNDYEYDRFQDLDLRMSLGAGLGYKAWRKDSNSFDLVGGAAYTHESFSTPLTKNSADAYWGDDFNYKISSVTTLSQTYRMFNNLSEMGNYRVNFDVGIKYRLANWLNWNVNLIDRYNNSPVAGRKTNDFIYATTLGLSFGSGE